MSAYPRLYVCVCNSGSGWFDTDPSRIDFFLSLFFSMAVRLFCSSAGVNGAADTAELLSILCRRAPPDKKGIDDDDGVVREKR